MLRLKYFNYMFFLLHKESILIKLIDSDYSIVSCYIKIIDSIRF